MISNPHLILYACIAKGATILAEFSSSKEEGIETVAQQCLELTPPHHSIFSHTIRRKTYTFLIDDPFVYFAIFDENLDKSESFLFLNRVKTAFDELILTNSVKDFDKLTSLCFQGQFFPVFREIMGLDSFLADSLTEASKHDRSSSVGSSVVGKGLVARPLLSKPSKFLMKKKKRPLGGGEANGDHHLKDGTGGGGVNNKGNYVPDIGNVNLNRDFSVSMQKNGGFYMGDPRQKAKQIWKKHVWVVLILDLVVCAVLFGIWLWVCQGFKCIDG